MTRLSSSAERATIADLECNGLSLRTINLLEKHLELLYVDELYSVTEEMVLGLPMSGPKVVAELRGALRSFLACRPVKTVRECIDMSVEIATDG
jgi:hypothetical protein